jgi:membrane protein YqaA with SNARE-associated domain
MNSIRMPHWMQSIFAALAAAGGVGLFVIALLDSAALPLPVGNDLLLIDLSVKNPAHMPYYALMSTLGSLIGCLILFFVARKGGELYFRKHAGARADRIRNWVANNGFLTMMIGALAPPPTPFKLFVIAGGALEMPVGKFALAITLSRLIRFFGEGYLAVRYGDQAWSYLLAHKLVMSSVTLAIVLALYLIGRALSRPVKVAI